MKDVTTEEIVFQALLYRHASTLLLYPEAACGRALDAAADANANAVAEAEDGSLAVCSADLLAESAHELAGLFVEGAREHELAANMEQAAREAANAADAARMLDLQRDYTALFIGALEMAAPPFASYWLDGAHQLGGPTTTAVEQAYGAYGMRTQQRRKQPGDHLSTMLEFLFVLLRDAASALEAKDADSSELLVSQARDFFGTYVQPWVGDMSALVQARARTDFYRDLGALLPLVVIDDSLLMKI